LNEAHAVASPPAHAIFQVGQVIGAMNVLQQSSSSSHCTRKHCFGCTAMLDLATTQRFMMHARPTSQSLRA
jgi:hypothetical protein